MTIEQIDARLTELDGARAKVKAEMVSLVKQREELEAREAAAKRVAEMGDAEKAALRQALSVESIESGEAVGEPGK
jgi:hypothetical protein